MPRQINTEKDQQNKHKMMHSQIDGKKDVKEQDWERTDWQTLMRYRR